MWVGGDVTWKAIYSTPSPHFSPCFLAAMGWTVSIYLALSQWHFCFGANQIWTDPVWSFKLRVLDNFPQRWEHWLIHLVNKVNTLIINFFWMWFLRHRNEIKELFSWVEYGRPEVQPWNLVSLLTLNYHMRRACFEKSRNFCSLSCEGSTKVIVQVLLENTVNISD